MSLKPRTLLLLVAILHMTAAGAAAATTEYAPIMPLAASSLLLDITAAGSRVAVAGERGHILYSDDDGDSWQQARVPTTQMLTGIHFADRDIGWAVGHDGLILASDDGGETWRIQRDGLAVQQQSNLEAREQAFRNVKRLRKELETSDEERAEDLALELEDAELDLEDADVTLAEPVHTPPLMDIWFQDAERGWAVGAFGSFLSTTDGGQHWRDARDALDNPDEYHLNAITGDGKGRMLIAGEGGTLFRSLDGGDHWETLEPVYEGSWFGAMYSATHDVVLVCGLQGNLYRSTDFGDSWQMVPHDTDVTLAGGSAADSGEFVVVGAVGTVLISRDGGRNFRHSMVADRMNLSSAMLRNGRLITIGQAGARVHADEK